MYVGHSDLDNVRGHYQFLQRLGEITGLNSTKSHINTTFHLVCWIDHTLVGVTKYSSTACKIPCYLLAKNCPKKLKMPWTTGFDKALSPVI